MTSDTEESAPDQIVSCDPGFNTSGTDWRQSKRLRNDAASDDGVDSQRAGLARIISARVIPRLLLAHGQTQNNRGFKAPTVRLTKDYHLNERVGEFADLVVNRDGAVATTYFKDMLDDGASIEALFEDLLGPTARRLGELWDDDINTMFDVAQGLGQLQHIVRTFSPEFQNQRSSHVANRKALLMPLPGETHVFGIGLIEQYFRREGWHVWAGPPATMAETVALVGNMWFDMIGFSVSRVPNPEKLSREIRIIRKAARNRNVAIMVGGAAFLKDPSLSALIGADGTASDGPAAIRQITAMIGQAALI